MKFSIPILTLLVSLIGSTPAIAGTVVVDPTSLSPDAFDNLQSAIDFAGNGDTVLVSPGTYLGGVTIEGKIIKLKSVEGPEETRIIYNTGPLLQIISPPSAGSSIEGFELSEGEEGAIRTANAILTIRNCIISNASASAISIEEGSQVLLAESRLIQNSSDGASGSSAHVSGGSTFTLNDTIVEENTNPNGATVMVLEGSKIVSERTFFCNNVAKMGGGIHANASSVEIRSTLFVGNEAEEGGAAFIENLSLENTSTFENVHFVNNKGKGHVLSIGTGGFTAINNSVITNNTAGAFSLLEGNPDVLSLQFTGIVEAEGSMVQDEGGNGVPFSSGEGMISVSSSDELFLHGAHPGGTGCAPGAWEPMAESPLVNAGDPAIQDPFEFPNHQESDMGAYGGPDAVFPTVNSDEDSHPDLFDNCPYDKNEFQEDSDDDSIGDICDETSGVTDDIDKDGVLDEDDNCIINFNTDQKDTDLDGQGDICDANDDDDPTPDVQDCAPKDASRYPGNSELCNGIDDDCDGLIDNGVICDEVDGGTQSIGEEWIAALEDEDTSGADSEPTPPVATTDDGGCQTSGSQPLIPFIGMLMLLLNIGWRRKEKRLLR